MMEEQEKLDLSIYFVSEEHKYVFALCYSDQAEAIRRKLDTHTSKELPKLKKQRGTKNDEITGEPLRKNSAFHHSNEKELFTDPVDVLDENKGINVNFDTHKEIHKQNIRTKEELKKKSESVRKMLAK